MIAPATGRTVNLGRLDRIPPGEGRCFTVEGVEIAVFHTRPGAPRATQARCPHRGGPLADGLLGENRVICPLHSRAFDLLTGASDRAGCDALQAYPARLNEQGEIEVDLQGEAFDG